MKLSGNMLALFVIAPACAIASPSAVRPLTNAETLVVQRAVAARLIDPRSAQFDMEPYRVGSDYYCGLVNARNRMGGYVGVRLFLVQLRAAGHQSRPSAPITSVAAVFIPGDPSYVGRQAPLLQHIYDTCAANGYAAEHLARVGYRRQ